MSAQRRAGWSSALAQKRLALPARDGEGPPPPGAGEQVPLQVLRQVLRQVPLQESLQEPLQVPAHPPEAGTPPVPPDASL